MVFNGFFQQYYSYIWGSFYCLFKSQIIVVVF
jgi:hypothetical protein